MTKNEVLIVGASGVNGYAVTKHFLNSKEYSVITLSKSNLEYNFDTKHIAVDLLEKTEITRYKSDFEGITHIFYAALKPNDDPKVEADENSNMFKNIIEVVYQEARQLKHVTFLQGGKVYGAHLGNYKTPAVENQSRHFPPNLYFEHEDFISGFCGRNELNYTALRPDIVMGFSLKSAMNMGNLLATYAVLCKEAGTDLNYPGSPRGFEILVNICDADMVAKACQWSFENESAANKAFNITNGDIFRWNQAWKAIADYFEIEVGIPQPLELETYFEANKELWNSVVQKYKLEKLDITDLAKGNFGDFIFNVERDAIFDVNKARRAGFHLMTRSSIASILSYFDDLKERNVIPNKDYH